MSEPLNSELQDSCKKKIVLNKKRVLQPRRSAGSARGSALNHRVVSGEIREAAPNLMQIAISSSD